MLLHDNNISEMAAILAHEIKNPTAVAMAHVCLIRQADDCTEIISHHLSHIEQSLMGINSLVQEMLRQAAAEPYEADIRELLSEMLETYRAAWPGISFTLDAAPPVFCQSRGNSLRIIFSNLLKNAVEAVEAACHSTGRITVHARCYDGSIIVDICDNGASPISGKPYGSGLGLAICRCLTGQLGGRISISGGEDGCVATVILPYSGV